jgi:AcrR family transcriptional regulator
VSAQKSLPGPSSGVSTRTRILRAAERLFADRGIGATSTRAILLEAEQRNESALQYHFGGREGLIQALYSERGSQVNDERQAMFVELEQEEHVDLRQLCAVALLPPVRLARRQPEFIRFLKVVGELVFVASRELRDARLRNELDTVAQVVRRMRSELDLPAPLLQRRFELIDRMAMLLLAQRARSDESFDGPEADLFFANTLDAMVAMLRAPVSPETQRALAALSTSTAAAKKRRSAKQGARGPKSTSSRKGRKTA